jgi:8-oxo-(d)GTP phosphatase
MSTQTIRRILAAGTVVVHPTESGQKVLLIHRPGYDDWSLPKGKAEPGETMPITAVRETLEETGVTVRLDVPIDRLTYPVGSGEKSVHYWRASVTAIRSHTPDREVDKVVWLTPKVALRRLSYTDEQRLLSLALEQPATTPVMVVRHGKAMLRKNWTQRDSARPLDARGRQQADDLVPLLRAYHVEGVASSTSTRCQSTLTPYAKAERLDVRSWATLSEEQGAGNEGAVAKLVSKLASEAAGAGRALALCGHRPVLPAMLDSLGIVPRPMRTGEACVAHLTPGGETVAVEWHSPLN